MYYPPTATQSPKPEKEQEQASGLSFLSASDFPVLGADLSLTKEQKTKVRDASPREGSGPVFNKGYHAQLRELLGENMRAVEAMEADQEDFNGRWRNRDMDQDMINTLMESVIREIAGDGELVTTKKVRTNYTYFFYCVAVHNMLFDHFPNHLVCYATLNYSHRLHCLPHCF